MSDHTNHIDLAARAMTDVEPPRDLEARIKRRLDAETIRTQPRWRPAYWLGAAGLTATAMILALVVQGPTRSTVQGSPEEPSVQGPTEATAHGSELRSSPAPRTPPGPWTVSNPGPHDSQPVRLPTYRSMSVAEWDWMSRRVPTLDAIAPIQPEPMLITPLAMTPLAAAPVFGDSDVGRQ